jgi:serine/threonine-protein kinase
MADPDATLGDFPTYASLTQTDGWATTAAPVDIRMQGDDVDLASHRYVESALLGAGGMGKVMLARDDRIGRDVAVKELHAKRAMTGEEQARFLREARVQGQLEHPSIVPVYDIDRRTDGTMFFTMRRVVGKTLHATLDELRRGAPGARTQHELLTAFATVCLAIDYAHSRGVIHRDLKPANIMLGDFGEVYVLDWGLARLVNDSPMSEDRAQRLSIPGELMGTPLYMAPEQMADPEVGPGADVFSLGAILFELLALRPLRDPIAPFVPADARPSVRTPDRVIAPELETICVTATAADPTDRYASARALQEAVNRYLEGDRDRELRHTRATTHAREARAALTRAEQSDADYETERGNAMREIARALAFDPTNRDHVAMLGEIFEKPPRVVPPEVQQQLRDEADRTVHQYAKVAGPTMMSWFLFLPFVLAIGVHDWSRLWWIAGPVLVSGLIGFYALARNALGPTMQLVTLLSIMLALTSATWMYGPVIITPMLITSATIVVQAFPARTMRRVAVITGIGLMTTLVVLELAGAMSSYTFDGGRMQVLPQLMELPRTGTLLFLLVVHLSALIVPCMFIAQLRRDLSLAQQRQLLHSWHFRRLGDQLMGTGQRGS